MSLYIITGASGLVGSNIIRKLTNKNDKIIAITNKNPLNYKADNVEEIKADVCDYNALEKIFQKYEADEKVCIHCAGIITIKTKNDDNVYNVNVGGTKNIINLCLKYQYKLIYVSSVHAIVETPGIIREIDHFDPDKLKGIYAKTKAIASNLVLEACKKGLKGIIVQPSAIIGPYDYNEGSFTILIKKYIQGKLPALIHGGYDFVDARDVADGIISAVSKGKPGECYILSNNYYSVKELIDTLSKVTNKKRIKIMIPTWIVKLLARPAEILSDICNKKALFTPYSIFVLNTNAHFSHELASKELNYKPRPLEETLNDTYKWIQKL